MNTRKFEIDIKGNIFMTDYGCDGSVDVTVFDQDDIDKIKVLLGVK